MNKNPGYDHVCDAVSKSNKSEIFEPTALSSRQHTFENMPVLCPPCFKLNIFCLNTNTVLCSVFCTRKRPKAQNEGSYLNRQ